MQVASASMDAQAVLDETHVEEDEDVNDVPEYMWHLAVAWCLSADVFTCLGHCVETHD